MADDPMPNHSEIPERSAAATPAGVVATAPAGAVPAAPDPIAELDTLKKDLARDQDQSATLAKDIEHRKAKIVVLQKFVDDMEQKKAAYEKGFQLSAQQLKDLDKYYVTKKAMLEATVPDKEAVVNSKKKGDQEVTALETKVNQLSKQAATDATEVSDATNDTQQRKLQNDFELSVLTRADARLKELSDLRGAIEKEGSKNNVSRMYFLILEMTDVFKLVDLPIAADYAKRLNAAVASLNIAVNTERDKRNAADKSSSDNKLYQKELDESRLKRRDKILQSIPENAVAATVPTPA